MKISIKISGFEKSSDFKVGHILTHLKICYTLKINKIYYKKIRFQKGIIFIQYNKK